MWFNVGEYLTLSVLYSLISYLMVEALLRLWLIRKPSLILRFRFLILALPPLCAALVTLFFADRSSTLAAYNLILFESGKWFRLIGSDKIVAWLIFMVVAVGGGSLFFSQTVFPIWHQFTRGKHRPSAPAIHFPKLRNALHSLTGILPPDTKVLVIEDLQPVAYVAGLRRLVVFISTGLLDLLDEEELAAVVAHEVSHIRRGDMRLSWVIFLLRALMFYNPIATFAFNQISLEMERACDEEVVLLTRKRLAFGSALIKVHRATVPGIERNGDDLQSKVSFQLAAWGMHARVTFTEDRVKRILAAAPQAETKHPNIRLALLTIVAVAIMALVT